MKTPDKDTLLEEVAELILSLKGKHEDPPELELVEIGGIAINLLRRLFRREDINTKQIKQVVENNSPSGSVASEFERTYNRWK